MQNYITFWLQSGKLGTDVTSEIYNEAKRLFAELWDGSSPLRLIGITLSKVVFAEGEQLSLLTDEKHERNQKLDKAVDAIRSKFGAASVVRGTIYRSDVDVGKKFKE